MNYIPYGSHSVDYKDLKNILKIKKKNIYTNGYFLTEFEKRTKKYLGSRYSIAVNSGTSAIHLAFKAINLKKGDNIIMPAVNFVAAYSTAKLCGANIFFADIDYKTGQMSPKNILECKKKNKIKKVKAFITMYLAGSPEFINDFYLLKKKLKCYFLEDACHAFGSSYKIKNKIYKLGSCKHADISTFSFHPVKTITTGEGGLITTNNLKFFNKIKEQRSHGIIRNLPKHWKYKINETSLNYRLSEINCILGISQLKKINSFLKKRFLLSKIYRKNFYSIKNLIEPIYTENSSLSAWHLYIVFINFNKLKINKDKFIQRLKNDKIIVQQHYIPLYKVLNMKGKMHKSFPNSERYFKNALSLPLFNDLSFEKQKYVINKIKKILDYAKIKKRTKK
tara:strand:+ start:231 stop:1409 length:1179 start_codon:yes stop_codon:yes gene_type:complete